MPMAIQDDLENSDSAHIEIPKIESPSILYRSYGEKTKENLKYFSSSGISVTIATGITHPIDVIKVRQQMQAIGSQSGSASMIETLKRVVRNEGYSSLYRGIFPALLRSMSYGGLRLGMYEPCKKFVSLTSQKNEAQSQTSGLPEHSKDLTVQNRHQLTASENVHNVQESAFSQKLMAGVISGAFATVLTNPMDFLKVRSQTQVSSVPNQLKTFGSPVMEAIKKEGIVCLWKGSGPSVLRGSVMTASQCAFYDELKQLYKNDLGFKDGISLHVGLSMISGCICTFFASPFDTIKTRMMNNKKDISPSSFVYKNSFHCAYHISTKEGLSGLYKGWLTSFMRICPQTVITFVAYEKMRTLFGFQQL